MRHFALIQRVRTDPFGTDYLSLDGAVPQWSDQRSDAVFFETYGEADARAAALGGRPIFAVVVQKPIPRDRALQHCNEPGKYAATRAERRRRREQAIASEDPELEHLQEVYI